MSIRVPEVARQKRLNDYSEINFECDVTMTNNGAGSGSLLLGLPFSAMGNYPVDGYNITTGEGFLQGYTSGANAILFKGGGGIPGCHRGPHHRQGAIPLICHRNRDGAWRSPGLNPSSNSLVMPVKGPSKGRCYNDAQGANDSHL